MTIKFHDVSVYEWEVSICGEMSYHIQENRRHGADCQCENSYDLKDIFFTGNASYRFHINIFLLNGEMPLHDA